jgi:hypothetical protein
LFQQIYYTIPQDNIKTQRVFKLMKILILLALIVFISLPLNAQDSISSDTTANATAIIPQNIVGGFAGPVFKFASLNGESGVMFGGHAAVIINNRYGIGFGSYGLTSEIKETDENGDEYDLYASSIGLELHFLPNAGKLMHWMGTLYVARAELQLKPKDSNSSLKFKSDPYFLLSPSVQFELNVTPVLMVNVGVGYHMAMGVDEALSVSSKDLSGLIFSASVVIGWF